MAGGLTNGWNGLHDDNRLRNPPATMMDTAATVIGIAALVCTGLLAGLMYAFSISVLPGLTRISATAFVEAMQKINTAILNPGFAISFGGAFLFGLVAVLLQIGQPALPWVCAAFGLNVVGYLITFVGNIPLNQQLDAADATDPSAAAAARAAFAPRWQRLNLARTVAHTLALIGFAIALLPPAA